ncbi:NUDIX hydrolase [Fulvivirga lutea]|uniref:NUDIX hydrolase n=1 Tax=Fulvivirga lutea TaxID=2810512 RepID=A0A974WEL2_9BACT|nr:NUDIX hydrolase [Fulvivirga lutea]QSE95963.1 NUDIX hydrolase [Fulvivirga lutea]
MHRKDLLDKINNYSPEDNDEQLFRANFLEFISNNKNCFERSLLKGHITGSAWIVNQTYDKALLTHHRKLDKWLQLGGHADGETDIIKVAKKEAKEESGLSNLRLLSEDIFDIDIHTIPERKGIPEHLHYDVRFLFQAVDHVPLLINHESKALKWVPLKELNQLIEGNRSIMRMVEKTAIYQQ